MRSPRPLCRNREVLILRGWREEEGAYFQRDGGEGMEERVDGKGGGREFPKVKVSVV